MDAPSALQIAILVVAVFAVAGTLWSEALAPRLEWLCKPAASLCFISLALTAGALESAYGRWLLAGLIFCLGGDVLLIAQRDTAFLAGLISFLLGHLMYAVTFLQLPTNEVALLIGLLPALALGVLSLRWLWPNLPAAMRLPVLAYVVVICGMLAIANGSWGTAPGAWIIVGAWGFAISDLAVARNQFVSPGLANRLWGIPLYFGSQMLLAWSAGLT